MTEIPGEVEAWLDELTATQLDNVARIVERRADDQRQKEREPVEEAEEVQQQYLDVHGDPLPDGVPAKATLTKKTINDNEYWYWQWRANDSRVTSKHKCPVNQD